MTELYARNILDLQHANNLVCALSHILDIPAQDFSIMGGFARRCYMQVNEIPLKPEDEKGALDSDIDIFCDIKSLLGDETMTFVTQLKENPYTLPEYIPSSAFAYNNIGRAALLDCSTTNRKQLSELFSTDPRKIEETINHIIKDRVADAIHRLATTVGSSNERTITYTVVDSKFNGVVQTERHESVVVGDLVTIDSEAIAMMVECITSDTPYDDPSFKVSPAHLSCTIPLGNKVQLVFGNHSNAEGIETFDMDQCKFKIDYPFIMEGTKYHGNTTLTPENFYNVETMIIKDVSPFRVLDRLVKYSNYGFVFSESVVQDYQTHVDEFIDKNPIQLLPTYTSGLY